MATLQLIRRTHSCIRYGFGKKQEKSAERDTWFFKHERFLKGREDLVGAVTATKIHGNTQIPMVSVL